MKTPVVQIVHYSDMHIVAPSFFAGRTRLHAFVQRLPLPLRQGVAAASFPALHAFVDFLKDIASERAWYDKPIWLIDTGDGTTFGDSDSLDLWLNHWTPAFLAAAGPHGEQLVLYGNHDAWPQTFPLLAPTQMEVQRDNLRNSRFQQTWPSAPLSVPLLHGGGPEVQLFSLNSVDHSLVANAAARGLVARDRFWQNLGAMPGPTAADDLDRIAAAAAGTNGGRHLRFLAMHYPVAHAAQGGRAGLELLANRDQFAAELAAPNNTTKPLAHVLLAGHTHVPHPLIGLLPNGLSSARHAPLAQGFGQIVTPSLSQILVSGPNGAARSSYYPEECARCFPYQCTLLRVFAEATLTGDVEVTVQRTIAGAPWGGAFGYLPIAEGVTRVHEELDILI
jgi:hypothetical protein